MASLNGSGGNAAKDGNGRRHDVNEPKNFVSEYIGVFRHELRKEYLRVSMELKNETEDCDIVKMQQKFLRDFENMKLNHARCLLAIIKKTAKSATIKEMNAKETSEWLRMENCKMQIIWGLQHDAKFREDFLFNMGGNDLIALKLFDQEAEIQEIIESELFETFKAKAEPAAVESE